MAFQPFGYRFDIRSQSPPSSVKATIKSRKKRWLDPKNGARGWIVGPFICLWFSAFDRHGPMLFGLISRDNFGARISGRAGSDLNGVLMFSLIIPLMTFIVYQTVIDGSASPRELLFYATIFLIGGPLIYWSAHKDRREAEPLIRFLRDTLTASGQTLRAKSSRATVSQALTLTIGGEEQTGPVTPDAIHDALLAVGAGTFVILASQPETYMQTASLDGGYILEMREGDSQRHFRAKRQNSASKAAQNSGCTFTFEEALAAFLAYASGNSAPNFLKWESLKLPE